MKRCYFITGTDTHIGKTWTTIALMEYFKRQGQTVAAMKPVAAGCEWQNSSWKNEDALLMQQHTSMRLPYAQINPYAFEQPVSPHLACGDTVVELAVLKNALQYLQTQADLVLVEGAGGWLSPLSPGMTNANLAQALHLPVILVVGLRLGCINHACLSYQAILQAGTSCAGWIAVELEAAMPYQQANIDYLQQQFAAPLLGVLPHCQEADFGRLASALNTSIKNLI